MFQLQHNQHRDQLTRGLAIATTAVLTALALGMGVGNAVARPDPGPTIVPVGDGERCSLARVGTQYVMCDNNTGNGVPAPAWVPER